MLKPFAMLDGVIMLTKEIKLNSWSEPTIERHYKDENGDTAVVVIPGRPDDPDGRDYAAKYAYAAGYPD